MKKTNGTGLVARLNDVTAKAAAWTLPAFTALAIALPLSGNASVDPKASYVPVEPTVEQARANILITRQLQFTHFRDLKLDESLSGTIFDSYLDYLDGQKIYLTQQDVDKIQKAKELLGPALKIGQLQPGFDIYNLVQKRIVERLDFAIALLEKGVDKLEFPEQDYLLIDRSDASWERDQAALDALWEKRVKNLVLSRRLDGSSDEDIQDALIRRFQSQRNRAVQIRSEDAFQAYMNAFTAIWDPHTSYFSPRTSENFNINMSLSLEGIGAVLQSDNEYTKVVRLVPGGPAAKQGQLEPADRIISVKQEAEKMPVNVIGWRLDEVVDLIRGPKNSTVTLEVIPANATDETVTRAISIKRDEVKLEEQSAKSDMLKLEREGKDYNIGVIDIPTFYADFKAMQTGDPNYKSTTRDVRQLIDDMKKQGDLDGLIIDLRNNGGGALHEARDLVGLFISEGPTVQIRTPDDDIHVMTDQDPSIAYDGPMIVLVNRMSASASEIFAGAIQDYKRGLVVGSQTFGKGTVQAVRPLNHGQLKITQSKFYRVSGGSTQHKGVIPDIDIASPIDPKRIGEDALPHALPWDQIEAVPHQNYFDFSPVIGELKSRHAERISKDEQFTLLDREIELLTSQRQMNRVSLNPTERRKQADDLQQRQLAIVNTRRKLDGKEPFKDFAELEDFEETQAADLDQNDDSVDFIVREGGQIMADFLELSAAAGDDKAVPITAKAP